MFIKYPSTGQFRDAIKQVQQSCKYHDVPLPVVDFKGTVKLHGTNAAVVIAKDGTWHCQSRERIITPEDDNAGFAAWVHGNKKYWDEVACALSGGIIHQSEYAQIYGEWCGGNIQKGVGVSNLSKMFVIFAIRFSADAESQDWMNIQDWQDFFADNQPKNLYFSTDFPHYSLRIDFNSPTLIQNDLVKFTEEVENECPVAKSLLKSSVETALIGEGIVWEIDRSSDFNDAIPDVLAPMFNALRFKVKGEKHSASKVKTIAPVDVEKVKSVDAFVEYACTINRLQQGLSKLDEMGLERSVKSTGDYIRWVTTDILSEELETMIASGIEPRDINGQVARKAREFFLQNI